MKIIITKDVIHKTNNNYYAVLVQFEDDDTHYFHGAKNWMPKDDEMLTLVMIMNAMSPTFREKLKRLGETDVN